MDMLVNFEFLQTQLFWLVLSFACLLGILWKFVTPALTQTLDARAAQIREDLDRAASLKAEAEQMLITYEKQLKTAQQEATDIVAEARKEAEDLAAKRSRELEAELVRKAQAASEMIELSKNKAIEELRHEVVAMTLAATEKVVAGVVDSSAAKKYAEEAVKSLNA